MKKFLPTLMIAATCIGFSSNASAAPEDMPLIMTIKSNIYSYQGPDNQLILYFGATSDDTEFYIEGPGYEGSFIVDRYYIGQGDDGSSAIVASAVVCSVTAYDDTIRIYGDASKLDYIDMHGTYLSLADLSGDFVNLSVIDLSHNELTKVDLSRFANLVSIDLLDNSFSNSADMKIGTVHPQLELLTIGINDVCDPDLDLRNFPLLQYFSAYNNYGLTHVDPSGCPDLVSLQLDATNISSIDVGSNPNLKVLNLSQTKVKNVDLSRCPLLSGFYWSHDGSLNSADEFKVRTLDLSHNPNLEILDLGGNLLTEIDLTGNPRLRNLNVARNLLTEIDLSQCPDLYTVNIGRNYFDFNTLPLPQEGWDYYYYQNPFPMEIKYRVGEEIDLSAKVVRSPYYDASGQLVTPRTYATVMAVPRAEEEYPIPAADYTYADGKITFRKAVKDPVYVSFHCTAFEEWDLTTAQFLVKTPEDFDKPSKAFVFIPSEGGEATLEMGVNGGVFAVPERTDVTVSTASGTILLKDALPTDGSLARVSFPVSASVPVEVALPDGIQLVGLKTDGLPMDSINVDASPMLTSLALTKAGLNNIYLGYNRELVSLDLSGNRLASLDLSGVRGDYEKWNLAEINLSHNRLTQLTTVSYEGIRSLDLSSNAFTAFDTKYYTGLVSLSLSGNELTGTLDLSENPLVRRLDIKGNTVSSLILARGAALDFADLSDNRFSLATLPLPDGRETEYRYAPQAPLGILPMASAINLTAQDIHVDEAGGTDYVWRYEEDGTVVDESLYTHDGGAFSFGTELIGKSIYCEMTNPLFPQFDNVPLATTPTLVSERPDVLVASFTTPRSGNARIGFSFNRQGENAVYVDWRGDGTEFEPYIYSADGSSPIYREGATFAGATAKVYTFGSADAVSGFFLDGTPLDYLDCTPMGKLEALDIHNAGLRDGCLKMPDSKALYELVLDGSNLSTETFENFSGLSNLNLAGNKYKTIDLSGYKELMFVQLSGNELESVVLGGNKAIYHLDLQTNRLTDIDLTGMTNLQELLLSDNELRTIDLAPVKERLRALYIAGNYFTFATLPLASDLGEYFFAYDYSNQKPIEVTAEEGDRIDLSEQASVVGTPTDYRWFLGDSQSDVYYDYYEEAFVGDELSGDDSEQPDFVVEGGVTTFLRPQDRKVICAMTNAQLPNLILYTRPAAISVSAVERLFAGEDGIVTVYSLGGVAFRKASSYADAISGLSPGVYVINRRKVLVR